MNVTGICVNYCTPELLRIAVKSIRKYYPDMKIIIIDGTPSDELDPFTDLKNKFTKVHHLQRNIGHGLGLNYAVNFVQTDFFLCFDSDIEMKSPCIEEMQTELIKSKGYGIGQIVTVNEQGFNSETGIKYLHPHFSLINKVWYNHFSPFIHHGAPFLKSMTDINKSNPDLLIHFPVYNFILHEGRGTVKDHPLSYSNL